MPCNELLHLVYGKGLHVLHTCVCSEYTCLLKVVMESGDIALPSVLELKLKSEVNGLTQFMELRELSQMSVEKTFCI